MAKRQAAVDSKGVLYGMYLEVLIHCLAVAKTKSTKAFAAYLATVNAEFAKKVGVNNADPNVKLKIRALVDSLVEQKKIYLLQTRKGVFVNNTPFPELDKQASRSITPEGQALLNSF